MYRHDRALILSGGGARGAYEIGVWKHLCERGWKPDLICGTSVGAINGAGIAAGLSVNHLVSIWKSIDRKKVYSVSIFRKIVDFILRRKFKSYMDTKPLRAFLKPLLDTDRIRKSDIELVISAVNVLSSEIAYFNNASMGLDHIMASSAIPVLFPWQYIDGQPYWDGGVMANTPVAPALERGALEIIVVLLFPRGGIPVSLPETQQEAVERLLEQTQMGSFEALMSNVRPEGEETTDNGGTSASPKPKIVTVAPEKMLGIRSLLDFSKKQSEALIQVGYEDAKVQLADFFDTASR
jgi:NTE family protein